jgi:enoyl-CoA hydratase/carnithine racemase
VSGIRQSGNPGLGLWRPLAEHAWLRFIQWCVEGLEQTGTGAYWFSARRNCRTNVISIAAISGNSSGGGAELGGSDLRIAEAGHFSNRKSMGLTTGIGGSSRLARLRARHRRRNGVDGAAYAQRLYDPGQSIAVPTGQALQAALDLASAGTKSATASAGLKQFWQCR